MEYENESRKQSSEIWGGEEGYDNEEMGWWSRKEGSGWECRGLVHEFVSGSNKLASPFLSIFYVFTEGKEQAEELATRGDRSRDPGPVI